MSNMYKSLRFLQANTVTELAPPQDETDAVRLVDLNNKETTLSQAITLGDTQEAQARTAAVSQLESTLSAQIAALEASYQSADQSLTNQLNSQIQAIISGFTIKDPVYALVNAAIALSGLTITSPSFTGTVPEGARILTIAQGGNIGVAHIDNRIWVASAGAWVPASDFDDATEIVRSVLVSVENGSDNFINTIYSLIEPAIFENAVVGTTTLRWARWQANDRVLADGTSIERNGITFSARLDPDDLILNANGIAVNPILKSLLRDLSNATGLLPVEQVENLLSYILDNPLNTFTDATGNLGLNGFKLTDVGDPTLATDAVNLQTYQAGINSLQADIESRDLYVDLTSGTVVDGDTVFTVTHNFNSIKVMKEVIDKTSGESVDADFVRVTSNLNTCRVIFRNNTSVSATQFAVLLHKVG